MNTILRFYKLKLFYVNHWQKKTLGSIFSHCLQIRYNKLRKKK